MLNRLAIFRAVCDQRLLTRRLNRLAMQARFANTVHKARTRKPTYDQLLAEIRRRARGR